MGELRIFIIMFWFNVGKGCFEVGVIDEDFVGFCLFFDVDFFLSGE